MISRVYLDWNATAPLRPEARAAMTYALDVAGNPSSVHSEGRAARKLIEEARTQVARAVGASSDQVVFTSGGTEANAHALRPGWSVSGRNLSHLIVSNIEHPSVLAAGQSGFEQAAYAPATHEGLLDLDGLRASLRAGGPALVSVMLANNETGAVQPVSEVAQVVHEAGGILHVDAIQGLGRTPIDVAELGADLLSLSAHKIGGPNGIGALVICNPSLRPPPGLLRGGGQERGRRAGTENVAGIAGFGAATTAATLKGAVEIRHMLYLRERFESGLAAIGGAVVFAAAVKRLPNTTLFALGGVRAETAVIALDLEGIAVSSGSACSSGKVQPSHVLTAMGVDPELSRAAIRVSSGYSSKEGDIDRMLETWRKLSGVLRRT